MKKPNVSKSILGKMSNTNLKKNALFYKNKYRIPSTRASWWDYQNSGAYFITICTSSRQHYFGKIINQKMQFSTAGVIADICWQEIIHHTKNVQLGAFVVMPNHIHGILILDQIQTLDAQTLNAQTLYAQALNVQTLHAQALPLHALNVQTLHATSLRENCDNQTIANSNQQMAEISPKPNSIHEWAMLGVDGIPELNGVQTLHATSLRENCDNQTIANSNQQMADISPKPNSIPTIIRSYKSAVTKHANRLGIDFGWQPRYHDHIIRNEPEFQRIQHYIESNPANWGLDKFSKKK